MLGVRCAVENDEPQLVTRKAVPTAVVHDIVPLGGLRDFYDVSLHSVVQTIAAQNRAIMSPAFGLYRGAAGDMLDVEVGFATERPVLPRARVIAGTLPGGNVARLTHFGGFDGIAQSWDRLGEWLAERNLTPAPHRWEVYVTEPVPDMDPAALRTELHWPFVPSDGIR